MTSNPQRPVDVVFYDSMNTRAYRRVLETNGLSTVLVSTIEGLQHQAAAHNGSTVYVFDPSVSWGYDSRPAQVLDECGVPRRNRIAFVASFHEHATADSGAVLMKDGDLGVLVDVILRVKEKLAK